MDSAIEAVHNFWFGDLDKAGLSAPSQHGLWFRKSDDTDQHCRAQFGNLVDLAVAGELQYWPDSDAGLVALVLLLDQFTRNIYRDTPAAFAGDARALALAMDAIDSGRHSRLPAIHRVFLYMPLEHSEDSDHQHRCVGLFDALADEVANAQFADFARYAQAHKAVIDEFGRFPHRNAILGRQSTAAEEAYLVENGGF